MISDAQLVNFRGACARSYPGPIDLPVATSSCEEYSATMGIDSERQRIERDGGLSASKMLLGCFLVGLAAASESQ